MGKRKDWREGNIVTKRTSFVEDASRDISFVNIYLDISFLFDTGRE